MKHTLTLLSLSIALLAATATRAEVTVPKVKPTVTISDGEVVYDCTDTNTGTYTTFRAGYDGVLTHAHIVRGDRTIFGWNHSDGVYNLESQEGKGGDKNIRELEKDLARMKSYFKTIALPAFTIKSDRTMTAQVGDTAYSPAANWEYVGGQGFSEAASIILKNDRGGVAILKSDEFLFAPPRSGKFQLGRKLGKLVALVEKDGTWFVQATDYLGEPTLRKEAANK